LVQEVPLLKETLRKLQVMVHPDKFGQHADASAANTQSLAALQVRPCRRPCSALHESRRCQVSPSLRGARPLSGFSIVHQDAGGQVSSCQQPGASLLHQVRSPPRATRRLCGRAETHLTHSSRWEMQDGQRRASPAENDAALHRWRLPQGTSCER
jgi:hypothetical protein